VTPALFQIPRWGAIFSGVLLAAAALAVAADAPGEAPQDTATLSVDLLYAPHGDIHDGFFTPWSDDPKTVWGLVRWWVFSSNQYDKRREPVVPSLPNDGAHLAGVEPGASITWVGHSTFAIHDGDDVILTDPHWGARALIPPRESAPGIPLEAVPADAFAILSHNHYDHLDTDTVERLPASVQWFVPLGLANWFRERGRPNVVELDWWQSARRGRWKITCLPSQHWSRRIGMDTNRALWCTWLLDSGERRYFFAGDTGYFHGFAEFGRRFGPIDVAMLPIGAYEPRWFMKWQHMDPAEAVRAFHDLRSEAMLGMHWGTFDLTDEPVDLPPLELARVVAEQGEDPQRVRALAVGETWRVPERNDRKKECTSC
jgi:N-acyl-phosphatidylethanolamine-hydrolysing phospholipase D